MPEWYGTNEAGLSRDYYQQFCVSKKYLDIRRGPKYQDNYAFYKQWLQGHADSYSDNTLNEFITQLGTNKATQEKFLIKVQCTHEITSDFPLIPVIVGVVVILIIIVIVSVVCWKRKKEPKEGPGETDVEMQEKPKTDFSP